MEEVDPSPFYAQFADAQPYLLVYPSRGAEGGPHWSDTGDLIDPDDAEVTDESIQAVPLGKGRYRLAARCDGPFSALRLNWGDEFEAEETEPGTLELQRVVMPQQYVHLRCASDADLVPERATAYAMPYFTAGCLNFSNDHPIAQLVHDLHGGWESLTGGILTFTIPQANLPVFWREMQARSLTLGSLDVEEPPFLQKKRPKPSPRRFLAQLSARPMAVRQGGTPR